MRTSKTMMLIVPIVIGIFVSTISTAQITGVSIATKKWTVAKMKIAHYKFFELEETENQTYNLIMFEIYKHPPSDFTHNVEIVEFDKSSLPALLNLIQTQKEETTFFNLGDSQMSVSYTRTGGIGLYRLSVWNGYSWVYTRPFNLRKWEKFLTL